MPLLEIKNLQVEFGSGARAARAVDGVSLSLEAGKTLCLVGESGSGKSVTALSVLGLLARPALQVESGSVRLGDQELTSQTERQLGKVRGKRVGMVFQEPMTSLNPVFTVGAQ
ncbi:MAG: hypothetical protein RIS56_1452, partial [Verrucomicrobiota bacterium]